MQAVKGYKDFYSIMRDGKVWSHRQHKVMKTFLIKNGYKVITLNFYRNPKKFLIHRLVAQTYIPNPLNLPQVNHKNGVKTNNRVENLEWCTADENTKHAMKNGLFNNKGSNHGMAKLNEKEAKSIKKLLKKKKISQKEIAKKFGVSSMTITNIKLGKVWCHVKAME